MNCDVSGGSSGAVVSGERTSGLFNVSVVVVRVTADASVASLAAKTNALLENLGEFSEGGGRSYLVANDYSELDLVGVVAGNIRYVVADNVHATHRMESAVLERGSSIGGGFDG